MSKLPVMQFYPSDWIQDTAMMSPEAKGVYIDLLSYCWLHKGLPTDLRELARLTRMDLRKFKRIWGEIGCKFEDTYPELIANLSVEVSTKSSIDVEKVMPELGDNYPLKFNRRLLSDLIKTIDLSKKNAKSGKKGGEANAKAKRGSKKGSEMGSEKGGNHNHNHNIDKEIRTEPIPSSISISNTEHKHCAIQSSTEKCSLGQKKKKQKRPVNGSGLKRFEEFWQTWPVGMKKDRFKCEQKWKTQKLDSIADQIISALKAQVEVRENSDGWLPRLKDPQTWINGKNWTDELPVPEIDPEEAFEQEMERKRQQVREQALSKREQRIAEGKL